MCKPLPPRDPQEERTFDLLVFYIDLEMYPSCLTFCFFHLLFTQKQHAAASHCVCKVAVGPAHSGVSDLGNVFYVGVFMFYVWSRGTAGKYTRTCDLT